MKNLCIAALTLLALTSLVRGESATFGWWADDATSTQGIERVVMQGPRTMNKLPDKKGPFTCNVLWQPGAQPILQSVSLVSTNAVGGMTTQAVAFTVQETAKLANRDINRTSFLTAALEFNEGDVFELTFKVEDAVVTRRLQIRKQFVPH